jgi:hypothetical protein
MVLRLLAPWLLLIAAAWLTTWLFRRPHAAAARDALWDSWVDPDTEGRFQKGAWTYAFENAGAGASLVSLLIAGSYYLFDDPMKSGVFVGLAVLLAVLCWPVTVRRPWLQLTPEGIAWKAPQSSTIQHMPWNEVGTVSLAWHARISGQVDVGNRHSDRKSLRIKARHLDVSPQALVQLLQRRSAMARARGPVAREGALGRPPR